MSDVRGPPAAPVLGVSLAVAEALAVPILAVVAVLAMVFAVRAERRGGPGARAVRGLGAACCMLAAVLYVLPRFFG